MAPDAKIGPYTVLGDGCKVGAGAVVADSLLWDGVVVEAWCHSFAERDHRERSTHWRRIFAIRRGSVIGHNARIEPNIYDRRGRANSGMPT